MRIQVLGPGCGRSRELAARVSSAISELGLKARVEEITDPARITEMGVLSTPALAADGKLLISGRVPSPRELKRLLSQL